MDIKWNVTATKTSFWVDATERAIKTAAQTAITLFTANIADGPFSAFDVNWGEASGFILGAAALSVLTSLVSSRTGDSQTAQFQTSRFQPMKEQE